MSFVTKYFCHAKIREIVGCLISIKPKCGNGNSSKFNVCSYK